MKLSLDCLTLTDASPQDHIRAAGAAGFDLVSLWLSEPPAYPRQLVHANNVDECRTLLADQGIAVHSIEAFDLVSEERVRSYLPALERGAMLGARSVLAYHGSNDDRPEALAALAYLVELASGFAIEVLVEPVALGRARTLREAAALIKDASVGAGIVFDSYHFVRSGGDLADLDAVATAAIRYVQLNDGPASQTPEYLRHEAMADRLLPGEGAFPLRDIALRLPRGIPWAVEAPQVQRMTSGLSAFEMALRCKRALEHVVTDAKL